MTARYCMRSEPYKFDMEHLTELLSADRARHPSRYSVVIVPEGAMFEGGEMVFSDKTTDAYGHVKLGGIGDRSRQNSKGALPNTIRDSDHQPASWLHDAWRRSRC